MVTEQMEKELIDFYNSFITTSYYKALNDSPYVNEIKSILLNDCIEFCKTKDDMFNASKCMDDWAQRYEKDGSGIYFYQAVMRNYGIYIL